MDFDPSTIARIGQQSTPDLVGAMGQALSMKALIDQNALQGLQLQQTRSSMAREAKLRELMTGADITTPESQAEIVQRLSENGFTQEGLQLHSQLMQAREAQGKLDQMDLDFEESRLEAIVNAGAPLALQAESLIDQGMSPDQVNQQMTPVYQQYMQRLLEQKMPNGKPLLDDSQRAWIAQHPTYDHAGYTGVLVSINQDGRQIITDQKKMRADAQKAAREAANDAERLRLEGRRVDLESRRVDLDSRRLSIAERQNANGTLTDDAVEIAAQRLLNGEQPRDVLANFGRGAQGAANISKVQNRFAELLTAQGVSPQDVTARVGAMTGLRSAQVAAGRVQGVREGRVIEANKFATIALQASANVPRSTWRGGNWFSQLAQSQVSDPKLAAFRAANTSLVNAYTAAVTSTGASTEGSRQHAYEMLNTADGPEAYKAVVDQLLLETTAALESSKEAQTGITDQMRAVGGTPQARPVVPQGGPSGLPPGVRVRQVR